MSDIDHLQKLYKDKHDTYLKEKFDILLNEETEYSKDFYDNFFFHYLYYDPIDFILQEGFEKVYNHQTHGKGTQDKYKIETNGLTFYSTITYYQGKWIVNKIDETIAEYQFKRLPFAQIETIKSLISQNLDKYIALLQFTDEETNMNLTGKVKNYTFAVMKSIETSFKDSLLNDNMLNKVFLIMIYVRKEESKRVKLYSKICDMKLQGFKNEVIDTVSDNKNIIIYRFN